jgi:hypothetical protein
MASDDAVVELLLANYAQTLKFITDATAEIPAERFALSFPTAPNHPAWTIGHLACSAAFLGSMFEEPFGSAFAEERPVFAAGSKPESNGNYGTREQLLARLTERHALLSAAVRSKHGEYFPRPTPERLRHRVPTIGDLAVYLLASHEHYHLAQINQWRLVAGAG